MLMLLIIVKQKQETNPFPKSLKLILQYILGISGRLSNICLVICPPVKNIVIVVKTK